MNKLMEFFEHALTERTSDPGAPTFSAEKTRPTAPVDEPEEPGLDMAGPEDDAMPGQEDTQNIAGLAKQKEYFQDAVADFLEEFPNVERSFDVEALVGFAKALDDASNNFLADIDDAEERAKFKKDHQDLASDWGMGLIKLFDGGIIKGLKGHITKPE